MADAPFTDHPFVAAIPADRATWDAERGLGSALAVAFLLQVTPSVWTVYRSKDTTGVSRGTWLLIFGELLCWGVFGIHEADPRLIVLGATGVVASLLVLARVSSPRADRAPATHLMEVPCPPWRVPGHHVPAEHGPAAR